MDNKKRSSNTYIYTSVCTKTLRVVWVFVLITPSAQRELHARDQKTHQSMIEVTDVQVCGQQPYYTSCIPGTLVFIFITPSVQRDIRAPGQKLVNRLFRSPKYVNIEPI